MDNKISFTVFIPCFGECVHLKETINSLLDQNYIFEIVVCTQGETDVSDILKDFPTVKTIHLEHPSSYKTRIYLFDKSESDYIYFMDDDDILPNGFFKYISNIIQQTGFLDLYRVPLKEFKDNEWDDSLRNQNFNYSYFLENKNVFLKKCFEGTYHNGIVHLFIKNGLSPRWFDVDVFQTEDRLLTFSIAKSVNTDICIINDVYYLYRKYPLSHSRTRDFLKGRDDFIKVNDCLEPYMSIDDLIFNSNAIILRVISYLKMLSHNKRLNKINFEKIYSNPRLFHYLNIFLNHRKTFKKNVGIFVTYLTKQIFKKRYSFTKFLINLKCKQELYKYGEIQF